jgi:phosphoglycerate dehydrogenase-like enzyme
MKKICITGDFPFTEEQKARLAAQGEVKNVTGYSSSEEWLSAVQGSDVILSDGDYLLENLEKLENVFVTYPYIELGAFDSEKLKENGVFVANTEGSNKSSVVQWVIFMVLSLFRKFPTYLNTTEKYDFVLNQSLKDKKAFIVGKGSIGTGIGEVLEALQMDVSYFERGEDLKAKSADADLVVNALNANSSSKNLLNEEFFMSLKHGSYYVSFVRRHTYDLDGVIKSLDAGVLAGAAIDCDPEEPYDTTNDFYHRCLNHEKILVTPHIAFATKEASARGREVAIQNIEAYLSGKPQNIITKV